MSSETNSVGTSGFTGKGEEDFTDRFLISIKQTMKDHNDENVFLHDLTVGIK